MRATPTLHRCLALFLVCTAGGAATAQSIGAGAYWSAGVCADAVPRTWGMNSYGQLGDSTTQAHPTAAPVYGLIDVVQMQGGFGHTVALASDSTVWCWGRNDYGALGNGTTTGSIIPVQVSGLDNVVAIAAGDFFTVALRADSTVWSWGHNNYGQLGNGTTSNSPVPVQASLVNITAIAGGRDYLLVLRADSTVWGYGLNDNGQLGVSGVVTSTAPVQAAGLDSVVAISASRYGHSTALRADGSVWTWGYNQFGQLGDGTTTTRNTPAPATGLSEMVAIAQQSGYGHTLAVRGDGTLWAWGYNLNGQLGIGSNTNSSVPVQVSGITDVVAVTCGDNHSVALKADGTAWAWGTNASGQLGDGTATEWTTPVAVTGICPSTTGIANDEQSGTVLQLFPNPTDGRFTLRSTDLASNALATVHNALGATVLVLSPAQLNGSEPVDLSGQPNGVYHVRVLSATGIRTQAVVLGR